MRVASYVSLALMLAAGVLGVGADRVAIRDGGMMLMLLMMPVFACVVLASVAFPPAQHAPPFDTGPAGAGAGNHAS